MPKKKIGNTVHEQKQGKTYVEEGVSCKGLLKNRAQGDVNKTDQERDKYAPEKRKLDQGFIERSYFRILGRVIPS